MIIEKQPDGKVTITFDSIEDLDVERRIPDYDEHSSLQITVDDWLTINKTKEREDYLLTELKQILPLWDKYGLEVYCNDGFRFNMKYGASNEITMFKRYDNQNCLYIKADITDIMTVKQVIDILTLFDKTLNG